MKVQSAFTNYKHREIESNGSLGVRFSVLTYNFSAMAHLFDNVIAGVWGEYRDHSTSGFYWTPLTREFAVAGYYVTQQQFNRLFLQGAFRYDYRRTEPLTSGTVIQSYVQEQLKNVSIMVCPYLLLPSTTCWRISEQELQ